jgi:diaminohydroxyphosphoribosylaminopyrimidine deaminase / 5-amino-6-(5-phosphoribosylamino)uracil reductase
MPSDSPDDLEFMRRAIQLGAAVKGTTGDNPWVGALVVVRGQVLGEGATLPPGLGHAEAVALRAAVAAGHEVEGATLYTTVEPCTFLGRTAACVGLILARKVARVVVGIVDPHPRVNGQGIQMLESAGTQVTVGVCAEEIRGSLAEWLGPHST